MIASVVGGNDVVERLAAVVVARLVVDIEEVMAIELCESSRNMTATNNHFQPPPILQPPRKWRYGAWRIRLQDRSFYTPHTN
jgi:hypothetical protein